MTSCANKLGLEGISVRDYVDVLSRAGTCAHYMCECFLRGEKPDLCSYSANEIELATMSFNKFQDWFIKEKPVIIASEADYISEALQYGGRIDLYAMLHDKRTLIDIKTSKGVYDDHFTQVAGGYRTLLIENDKPVDIVIILRLGRNEIEGFDVNEATPEQIILHEKRFALCREMYDINKKLGVNAWR